MGGCEHARAVKNRHECVPWHALRQPVDRKPTGAAQVSVAAARRSIRSTGEARAGVRSVAQARRWARSRPKRKTPSQLTRKAGWKANARNDRRQAQTGTCCTRRCSNPGGIFGRSGPCRRPTSPCRACTADCRTRPASARLPPLRWRKLRPTPAGKARWSRRSRCLCSCAFVRCVSNPLPLPFLVAGKGKT